MKDAPNMQENLISATPFRMLLQMIRSQEEPFPSVVNAFADFVVTFSTLKALGFYCVLDRKAHCRIRSLSPVRQLPDDLRLQPGTRILSVAVGESGGWKRVISPASLRKAYKDARMKSLDISLKCVNSHVTKELIDMASERQCKECSFVGQCQGCAASGWDGGATLIDSSLVNNHGNSNNSQCDVSVQALSVSIQPEDAPTLMNEKNLSWVPIGIPRTLVSTKRHSLLQIAGKKQKMARNSNRVRWCTSDFETRQYVKDSLSYQFLVNSVQLTNTVVEKISQSCQDEVSDDSMDELLQHD
jgi:hypothetical protein